VTFQETEKTLAAYGIRLAKTEDTDPHATRGVYRLAYAEGDEDAEYACGLESAMDVGLSMFVYRDENGGQYGS
jgi:hypothetical protein